MTAITQFVDLDRRGRIAVLTVNNPPVNALSHGVRLGLRDGLRQAGADPAVGAIVIVCAGRTFIARADITRFGPPEVMLGLLPGAGGTQRLPRVVGVPKALQMIVGGDPIGGEEAQRLGLVDELVDGDLAAAGVAFAEKVLAEKRPLRKVRDMTEKIAAVSGKPEVFAEFRKSVARQTRGFRAPESCIKAVEAAVALPFDEGLKRGRELFLQLLHSAESKAQRHVFFAEREAAKIPDVPPDTPTLQIKKAALLGAGTMGAAIPMNFLN